MIAMFRRNRATAERIEQILRLPDDMWSDVEVRVGTDGPAEAVVTMYLTGEQLVALATLAAEAFAEEAS